MKPREIRYSTVVFTTIICLIFNLFDLTPYVNDQGGSNLPDVAQLLMLATMVFALARSNRLSIMSNKITWLVLFYLFLVGIEIALATLYHGQSLKDGIIAARDQYFYLSFFLALLLLDDVKKLHQLLNVLTVVALIVFGLSIINYIGIPVFHGLKADVDIIRSGIKRAYIPGFRLVSMVFIWQFARWLSVSRDERLIPAFLVLIFLAEHIFRQSRVAMIGVVVAAIVMLVATRRYRLLAKAGAFMLVATLITGVFMEKNIIIEPFVSSVQDVENSNIDKVGTWNDRLKQIAFAWEEFKEHPWLGSGSVALRISTFKGDMNSVSEISQLAYKSDLGYTQIIKAYGLVGTFWLVTFLLAVASMARRALRAYKKTNEPLLLFAAAYIVYVIFTLVTLNHIMFPGDITLLFIVVGILVTNSHSGLSIKSANESGVEQSVSQDDSTIRKQKRVLRYRGQNS